MTTAPVVQSVADVLQSLSAAKKEAEARLHGQLAEVDDEIARIQQAISNLTDQIEALKQYRSQLASQADEVGETVTSQGYEGIFGVLQAQAGALAERATAVASAQAAQSAKLQESLTGSDVAPLFAEYNQFKQTMEPMLSGMPESYRELIVAHHKTVAARLEAHLAEHRAPVEIEGDEVQVDLVIAVDVDEDGDGVVMIVCPVSEDVHTRWSERGQDLQTLFAARVCQGLYTALRGTPLEGIQAMQGGHQGLLAMEMELPAGHTDGFGDKLNAALAQVLSGAPELTGAKVTARLVTVDVDLLLPPEDEEGADA